MEDEKILHLLQTDTEQGFLELSKKYSALAYTIISRILIYKNQDIEECVADTFIRIWKNSSQINIQANGIKGYVVCTARTIAIDRYRKLKKEMGNVPVEEYMPDDTNIADQIECDTSVNKIYDVIKEFKEPDKTIFLRRYFYAEPIKSIANAMKMGEKAVESRLFRGRKKLKEKLIMKGVLDNE